MKIIKPTRLLGAILVFSTYATHVWINSFYIAPRNVDFSKYYDYINYFLGLNVDIDYGQGILYYYLISIAIKRKIDIIDFYNSELIISSAVHNVNLIFFITGLIGLYYLLKLKNFKNDIIIISLIVLVFFPQTIYMRAVMKPEIIGFAFLPWIILFIEKFIDKGNIKFIYYAVPFLAIVINSKASTAGMIIIFLLFSYWSLLKKIKFKNIFIIFVLLLSVVSILQIENYGVTNNSIIDRPYDKEYDFRAEPSVLYKVSVLDLVREPFFKIADTGESVHSRSLINLLLLDSFGDHFNQLFDFQANYFMQYRKDFVVNDSEVFITPKREINYTGPFSSIIISNLDHLRKMTSLFWSTIFYVFVIVFSLNIKKYRKFYLAPLSGIFLLYINSLGVPSNNFNPIKGDTFKAFYFGSLLSISFIFMVAILLKRVKIMKFIFPLIFILSTLFIAGHPRENSQFLSEHLVSVNQHSIFCNINNYLIYENEILKKIFPSGNINNIISNCKPVKISSAGDSARVKYDEANLKNCVNEDNEILNNSYENASSNTTSCRIYTFEQVQANRNLVQYRFPYFSVLMSLVSLLFILDELSKKFRRKIT